MTPDEFINLEENKRTEFVEKLFEDPNNLLLIKKLLLLKSKDKFDSELISVGIFSAIIKGNDNYFHLLFEFANKNNKKIEIDDARSLLNTAFSKNRLDLVEYIDNKFGIIKKDLKKERSLDLDEFGVVHHGFGIGEHYPSDEPSYVSPLSLYRNNVFCHQLQNNNGSAIKFILAKGHRLENSLVASEVIEAIEKKNDQILSILLHEPATKEIIETSPYLAFYLDEPTQDAEMKKHLKDMLKIVNLKNELSENLINNTDTTKRPKM